MKRWAQLISITLISLVWHASGALLAPDRVEARGVRGPRMATRPMKPPRMKTYRFNGKDIYGYRNFVRQRREAKLASGGFKMRKDGSVVHKDMHIRVGRYSKKVHYARCRMAPLKGPCWANAAMVHPSRAVILIGRAATRAGSAGRISRPALVAFVIIDYGISPSSAQARSR